MADVRVSDKHEYASMAGRILWLLFASMLLSVSASHKCSNITNLCAKVADDVLVVEVDASAVLATTDEAFLCATLDWWPPDKCDYGTCAWGQASLLNLVSQKSKLSLFISSRLLAVVLYCLTYAHAAIAVCIKVCSCCLRLSSLLRQYIICRRSHV